MLEPPVGARRRLLDEGKGADKFRKMPNRHPSDRKIFDRPQRMNAPIHIRRNLRLAEKVVLAPRRDAVEVNHAGRCECELGRGAAARHLRGKRRLEWLDILFCHEGWTGFKRAKGTSLAAITPRGVPQGAKRPGH